MANTRKPNPDLWSRVIDITIDTEAGTVDVLFVNGFLQTMTIAEAETMARDPKAAEALLEKGANNAH